MLRSIKIFLRHSLTLTVVAGALAGCATDGRSKSGRLTSDKSEAALLRAGDLARNGGDLGSAAELYRRAATIAPDDFAPYIRLGEGLYAAGAYTDAFTAYSDGLARSPDTIEIVLKLGKLSLILNKPEQAIGYFEQARREHGDDASILSGLGVAHDLLGDHAAAQADYRAGMKLAPDNLAIRNNFGLSQALSGDYDGAIATLSAVVADPRATARYRQNLALAYGLSGDNVKASITGRRDIGDADSASNQEYYTLLRSMDDRARTRAILGSEFAAVGGSKALAP
jgi:Flp pilus assembly protein TadD